MSRADRKKIRQRKTQRRQQTQSSTPGHATVGLTHAANTAASTLGDGEKTKDKKI